MSLSPENSGRAPSDRLWQWFQSVTRTAESDKDGVSKITARQVYILPTMFGVMYGLMLLAMLVGSNNYGSNPGFLFTFLLAGLGMAALFQTWKNLVGLELTASASKPVFCGQEAVIRLQTRNPFNRPRPAISAHMWRQSSQDHNLTDLAPLQTSEIEITLPTERRGHLIPGRVVLHTRYPIGLLKSWAYFELTHPSLVYPTTGDTALGLDHGDDDKGAKFQTPQAGDDFAGHKPYQDGDNVMHVDWKAVARGKGWNLKKFEQSKGEQVWLRWRAAEAPSYEQRISGLARSVVELDNLGLSYGLEIPGTTLQPDHGVSHRHQCLEALALMP